MDYNLAALKLSCAHLKQAKPSPSPPSSFTLGDGLLFQRAWLQGVLVSVIKPDNNDNNTLIPRFLLDDGTGIIGLSFSTADFNRIEWQIGMYVMVVGSCIVRPDETPMMKIHKIVDLSPFPDREAMWYLEVIEAYIMLYQPIFEESLNME